jgi:hypothetical protein
MKKIMTLAFAMSSLFAHSQLYTPAAAVQTTSNPSTNNVGIGINAPEAPLDVRGRQILLGSIPVSLGYSATEYPSVGYNMLFTPTASNYTYRGADHASLIHFHQGGFRFKASPFGTAGAAIPFTEVMTIKQDGSVGIGVTAPQKRLEVNAGANNYASLGSTFNAGQFSGLHFGYFEPGNSDYRKSALIFERTDNSARGKIHILNNGENSNASAVLTDAKVTIDHNGNTGIGLVAPEGKLHVKGCAYFGNENGNSWHRIAIGGSAGNYGSIGYGYKYSNTDFVHTYSVADYASQLRFDLGGFNFLTAPVGSAGSNVPFSSALIIRQDGNVGIGTSSPDAKLAVKGHIHTQEVRVDLTGAVAPDYVFEKNYNLLPLSELETYITQNKHLPEVPSAKEMEVDGLNLKEMNLILLKKVEELTLHLIELSKENEAQQNTINQQQVDINTLLKK